MNEMFNTYPDVVTVNELAEMLHIGKNKAYEIVNSGMIPDIRIGKKHLIPKSKVVEFLENVH